MQHGAMVWTANSNGEKMGERKCKKQGLVRESENEAKQASHHEIFIAFHSG